MTLIITLIEALKNGILAILDLAIIIFPLMIVIEVLKDLRMMEKLTNLMSPLTNSLKIHKDSSLPLVIGVILGLFLGAGVLVKSVDEGNLDKRSLVIVSIFLGLCHAVFEDTVVFVPIGANLLIVLLVRIISAFFVAIVASKFIKEMN
ncbi:MAG: nucleoside recognition protein [Dethiosulfatibacter sp.]|nr:nucleoside recognition protein [Dethiosulfatibacter sp.]